MVNSPGIIVLVLGVLPIVVIAVVAWFMPRRPRGGHGIQRTDARGRPVDPGHNYEDGLHSRRTGA